MLINYSFLLCMRSFNVYLYVRVRYLQTFHKGITLSLATKIGGERTIYCTSSMGAFQVEECTVLYDTHIPEEAILFPSILLMIDITFQHIQKTEIHHLPLCSLVWAWKEEQNFNFMPQLSNKCPLEATINLPSWSERLLLHKPCNWEICIRGLQGLGA